MQPSLGSQLLSFFSMAWLFRSNLTRALNLQVFTESYRPRKPFWYLSFIATHPNSQGKGIGASLLGPMKETAKRQGLPIYLECSNQQNLSFYRSQGFRLIDKMPYPGGPTIWPMILDR